MLKREYALFLTAVMFYTRIPCPPWVGHDAAMLSRATRYFPAMGYIVGAFSGLVFTAAILSSLSAFTAALAAIAAGIWLTGAFHEDGFADACDGFGGGWTPERILDIMKDSRVGAYGAIGTGLMLILKASLVADLYHRLPQAEPFHHAIYMLGLAWLTAHACSRFCAVYLVQTLTYARANDADGKAKPVAQSIHRSDGLIAAILAALPLALLSYQADSLLNLSALAMAAALLAAARLGKYFTKWIGGYTGDCLGATQQVCEVILLTGFTILCRGW